MGRPRTGEVLERPRTSGERTFSLRVRFQGRRLVIPLGVEAEGWNRRRAERELRRINDQIERGAWRPPGGAESAPLSEVPTLQGYASRWLARKRPTLADRTYARYRWMLTRHVLRHLGGYRVPEIDHESVHSLTRELIREREDLVEAMGRGDRLRYSDGAVRRPVSNNTINEMVALLGRILDDAIEDELLTTNPARGRRRRLRAEKRSQPWFESDEFVSLLEAARALDDELGDGRRRTWARTADRSMKARQLRAEGHSWEEIAAAVGVKSPATAHRYAHLAPPEVPAVGHRELGVALLGFAGMRASELVNLRWNAIDFAHGRIRIGTSKTAAGVRDVDMVPWLRERLLEYKAERGERFEADAPVITGASGAPMNTNQVNRQIVRPALRRANLVRAQRGQPTIHGARLGSHAFRRTYITLMFEAGASPAYVMDQVGHEDSKTTLGIYAKVSKRRSRREIGERFQELMRDAVPSGAHDNIWPVGDVDELQESTRKLVDGPEFSHDLVTEAVQGEN